MLLLGQYDEEAADGLECQRREQLHVLPTSFSVGLLGSHRRTMLIAGAAIGTNQSFSARDLLVGFFGLALLIYFGLRASREWRQARVAD
jgi:hypothetical protein